MTKEEKIKEAYGRHWNKIKDTASKYNGWITNWFYVDCGIFDCEMKIFGGSPFYRPNSLQGIDNNNGWIKIESELDLPKEEGQYYTISKSNQTNILSDYFFREEYKSDKNWWIKNITHYQPIIKPLPPIY